MASQFLPEDFSKFFVYVEFESKACHSPVANEGMVYRRMIVFFPQFFLIYISNWLCSTRVQILIAAKMRDKPCYEKELVSFRVVFVLLLFF